MVRNTIAAISVTLFAFAGCAGNKAHQTYYPQPVDSGYSGQGGARGTTTTTQSSDGYGSTSRAPATRGPGTYHRTSRPGSARGGSAGKNSSPSPSPQHRRYRRSGVRIPPPAPGRPPSTQPYRRRETRHIVRPQPTLRPGLATVFGERVRSRVSFTSFQRASTRPAGKVSIHYNDYRGLVAMTRHLRRRCCGTLSPYRIQAGITIQLVDQNRRPLRGVQLGGRTIVMGRSGTRYGILVQSYSSRRHEIVASVDGLDVIDGKRAGLTKRGYILAPYGRLFIRGFRTSRHNVAAFRFGSVRNSYAARTTGNTRNVGVVGLAVFSEYRPTYNNAESIRRLRARPFAQPPR
jgi:hypothetical protein